MKDNSPMIKVLKSCDAVVFNISRIATFICGAILIGTVLIICAGVFNRMFIHQSWMFVEEWTGLALIPMSYLSLGYTLRYNKHLKMDLLVNRMSIKWQKIFAIFAAAFSILCIVYFLLFSYNWLEYCLVRHTVSSGPMQTPLWIFSLTILIGCAIMMLDMICFLICQIVSLVTGKNPFHFYEYQELREEGSEDVD